MTAFNAVALSLGCLLSRADKRFLLTLRVSPQMPQLDLGRTKP